MEEGIMTSLIAISGIRDLCFAFLEDLLVHWMWVKGAPCVAAQNTPKKLVDITNFTSFRSSLQSLLITCFSFNSNYLYESILGLHVVILFRGNDLSTVRIRQRTKKEDCRWEIYERLYFPWIEVEDLRTVIIFILEHYSKDFWLVVLRTTSNPPLLTKWCEGRANGN